MAKSINVEGQLVPLRKLRTSKKGAVVIGARLHLSRLGTVYIQVYEPEARAPARPPSPRTAPQRREDQVVSLLRAMSRRLDALEEARPLAEEPFPAFANAPSAPRDTHPFPPQFGGIPPPRPTH